MDNEVPPHLQSLLPDIEAIIVEAVITTALTLFNFGLLTSNGESKGLAVYVEKATKSFEELGVPVTDQIKTEINIRYLVCLAIASADNYEIWSKMSGFN